MLCRFDYHDSVHAAVRTCDNRALAGSLSDVYVLAFICHYTNPQKLGAPCCTSHAADVRVLGNLPTQRTLHQRG